MIVNDTVLVIPLSSNTLVIAHVHSNSCHLIFFFLTVQNQNQQCSYMLMSMVLVPSQSKANRFTHFHFCFGCLAERDCSAIWTYSTSVGSGCCGREPSGLEPGTVWSSSRCRSSRAGCSLQCGHSRRWSLSVTGAAGTRCSAASTPGGRSHCEEEKGWGKRGKWKGRGDGFIS